ncbi:hypothetical protein [Paenibacillus sp. SI8]|uniref:hypothetical protein n=1 Tax=unclassified Paenibacillus TaxID=185978 RepID=UPI0034655711
MRERINTWKGGEGTADELDWIVPFEGYVRKRDEAPRSQPLHEKRLTGKVTRRVGGYGFIRSDSGRDYFVHVSDSTAGRAWRQFNVW